MAVQIVINQAGKPPGVAGVTRKDIATGTPVTLTAVGGSFQAYQWSILSRPLDVVAVQRSAAVLATPDQSSTVISPIDLPDTYFVQVSVDSGSGLGAGQGDVARTLFYAGPQLGVGNQGPRRRPAFGETTEDNAPTDVDPLGNPEGWRQEMERWFVIVNRHDQQLESLEGTLKVYSTVQNLTANNTSAALALFRVTGSVLVLKFGVTVKAALSSNVTGVNFAFTDSVHQQQITSDAGVVMSSAPAGAVLFRAGLQTDLATLVTGVTSSSPTAGTQVHDPPSASAPVFSQFEVTAPPGANCYLLFLYASTNTPASGSVQGFCEYVQLSSDGLVVGQ